MDGVTELTVAQNTEKQDCLTSDDQSLCVMAEGKPCYTKPPTKVAKATESSASSDPGGHAYSEHCKISMSLKTNITIFDLQVCKRRWEFLGHLFKSSSVFTCWYKIIAKVI